MIALWLVFAVMIVIALAFILPPLLQRTDTSNATEVKEANIAVYRDQMRELEADLSNGIVSKEQYAQDREELARRLLEDVSSGNGSKARNSRPPIAARNLAFGLAIAIPVIATLFYLKIGNQNARSETVATTGAQASSPSAPFANQSAEMTPQQIVANVLALDNV